MNLNTSTKLSLTVACAVLALLIAMLAISAYNAFEFATQSGVAQQEASMRVAWDVLRQAGTTFERRGDLLRAGDRVLNNDIESVDRIKALQGGVATVFMGDIRVTTNIAKADGTRAVGTPLAKGPVYDAVLGRGAPYRGEATILDKPYFAAYDPIKNRAGEVIGILFVGVAKADYFEPVYRQLMWLAATGILLAVAGTLASILMVRRQLRPLHDIRGAMARVKAGELDFALPFAGRRDDIGLMAEAVHAFRDDAHAKARLETDVETNRRTVDRDREAADAMRHESEAAQALVVDTLAACLGQLAQGDLTARIEKPFSGQYQQIKADFNAAIDSLRDAMRAIAQAAGGLNNGSKEIASASDDLSRRTEQQAASLEETAAALDEITATVKRSAAGVAQAAAAASGARGDAERSGTVVREAVSAMGAIEQSSDQIANIIVVMDEIAFQTNLLALNAGVEAARAGEAGRGFAVVAQEVRTLAQRSANAAKEIKLLIAKSSVQVERGVKLVGDTGQALDAIRGKVAKIDTLLAEVSQSAQEQATGLNHVNAAIGQMDQVTQQNAAMVEQTTAASASLMSEAAELGGLVSRFRIAERTRPEAADAARHGPGRNPVAQVRAKLSAFVR